MPVSGAATLDIADADAVRRRKDALRASTFRYRGRTLSYHVDGGNKPFDNERAVELAIAEHVLSGRDPETILEVGNVLAHYFGTSHAVLDKFEDHRSVTWNEDVLTFVPPFAPALIISVSTLEHVGHVETPADPTGFPRAVEALLSWLPPGGELFVTMPLGYNPSVLALLEAPGQPFDEITFMKRVSSDNTWVTATSLDDVRGAEYGRPFPCGNVIAIARALKPGVGPIVEAEGAQADGSQVVVEATSSADLKDMYDRRYYARMAGGNLHQRKGHLRELTNVWRAAALILMPNLKAATDVGAGRGELARHLIGGGTRVTLLDYAEPAIEIAREYVGSSDLAAFVVGDAARLSEYVEPGSQDAVFMTDVVEHLSTAELRVIFREVRQVLAPGGTLVVHTPEKYYGSVTTTAAVQGVHINLFQIDTLRDLLAEAFEWADAFTWNGVERFASRGKCIELFGIGRNEPYPTESYPEIETMRTSVVRLSSDQPGAWTDVTLITDPPLASRFILRLDLARGECAEDARIQVLLRNADGTILAWTGVPVASLIGSPADLFLASETFNRVLPGEGWSDVASVTARAIFTEGGGVELSLTDIRVIHA